MTTSPELRARVLAAALGTEAKLADSEGHTSEFVHPSGCDRNITWRCLFKDDRGTIRLQAMHSVADAEYRAALEDALLAKGWDVLLTRLKLSLFAARVGLYDPVSAPTVLDALVLATGRALGVSDAK